MKTMKAHAKVGSRKSRTRPHTLAADLLPPSATRNGVPKSSNGTVPPRWATHYRALSNLRASLMRDSGTLAHSAAEETPSAGSDTADVGADAFDRDILLSLVSSKQDALLEIEEALGRIRNNTYGVCQITGAPIPARRLKAIPWTRFGIEAQLEIERSKNSTDSTQRRRVRR